MRGLRMSLIRMEHLISAISSAADKFAASFLHPFIVSAYAYLAKEHRYMLHLSSQLDKW
jgi:hypothetical protein